MEYSLYRPGSASILLRLLLLGALLVWLDVSSMKGFKDFQKFVDICSLKGLYDFQKFNASETASVTLQEESSGEGAQTPSDGNAIALFADGRAGAELDKFNEKVMWDIVDSKTGWIMDGKSWHSHSEEFTAILRNMEVPRWKDAPDEDRLGEDVWLPPRLPIADDIRTLEYGVLLCGVGKDSYAKGQIVPFIKYLKESLGIPDAEERAAMRAKGDMSRGALQGFAIMASQNFVDEPLKPFLSFFDAVYTTDDLAKYPFDWQKVIEKNLGMVKIVKVHTISASPFDRTFFIDFDSFPCRPDFGKQLLEVAGDADFAASPLELSLGSFPKGDSREFLAEHNSAVVYFNMKSVRFRLLAAMYVQAYHKFSNVGKGGKGKPTNQRDQSALMIAMQSMVESFQPRKSEEASIPNKDVRGVIEENNLGFLQHADFAWDDVCRAATAGGRTAQCGPDLPYAVAHKDQKFKTNQLSDVNDENRSRVRSNNDKVFALGFEKTGNISTVLNHAGEMGGGMFMDDVNLKKKATNQILAGKEGFSARRMTSESQYFAGLPFSMREWRLYRELAIVYPTSRYILTVCDPDKWYQIVMKTDENKKIFGANSTSKEDFIAAMHSHNDAVRSFFQDELKQPERLLEIDMFDKKHNGGAGWKILCEFLDIKKRDCPQGTDLPSYEKWPTA